MSENRWQAALQTIRKVSLGAQNQLSLFTGRDLWHLFFPGSPKPPLKTTKVKPDAPVSKEELGRATWTFLHTLAAQYPGKPTKKQKKDVRELMDILSRLYPCKDCADHFKNILSFQILTIYPSDGKSHMFDSENPIKDESQAEFAQWLCVVHNDVNKRLDKVPFPCRDVDRRWAKLECPQGACALPDTAVDEKH